ncbi:MAG: sugar transferase, partial [Actinomycetota bacterium]|nr:sugar transferase [Actinomycetota bacterium]
MYKFRTMGTEAPSEVPTHEFSRSQDFVTTSGRVLRKSSIDELPQLWNILRGDMSFVGPRPALWNQYDLIEARERYGANSVTPGLTGWAQINGRDELSISKKAALDGHYVLAMGPLLDARCILGSVVTVVRADGVREGDGGRPAPSAQQLMPDGEAADPDSTVAGGRQQC